MAMNEPFDWRRFDRRLYAGIALLFPVIVLIGFARTYYLKFAFGTPPVPSLLVHIHSLVMTLWVGFFISQVWLIRTRNARLHMRAGIAGIFLGVAVLAVGFFTAVASAKFGTTSAPPNIPPLSFVIVPLFDLVLFTLLFGGAIYYRKRPAEHKRLMLLTVINFLPPAIARIPVEGLQSLGPLFFFGAPTLLVLGLLAYDTYGHGKINKVFLAGTVLLILSYPLRLMLSGTAAWMNFAAWLTTWAA